MLRGFEVAAKRRQSIKAQSRRPLYDEKGEPIEYPDEDPLLFLRRLREWLSRRYKTTKALGDYLRTAPTAKEFLAQLDEKAKSGKCRRNKKKSPTINAVNFRDPGYGEAARIREDGRGGG